MKIAVCDSSSIYRDLIADILNLYFSSNFDYKFMSHEFIKFENSASLIYDFEEGRFFDIIFIDVYMKKMSGIDAARKLREKGYKGAIILVSETAKYAVEGYEVGAFRYMIKPFGYEEIAAVMDKLVSSIEDDAFVIHKRNEIIRLSYRDIVYVDSSNTKCFVHSIDNEKYVVYKRLDEIEKELNESERNFRKRIELMLKSEASALSISIPDEVDDELKYKKRYLINSKYEWVKQLYPTVETDSHKVFMLSMSKFLYGNSTIIEPTYKFINNRITDNAIIFIDEFDSTKHVIDSIIIENTAKKFENKIKCMVRHI